MRPHDTTPEAHKQQIAAYRRMPGEQRVLIALRMSEELREITLAGIQSRHPDYTPAQARDALLRLILGDDLYRAAYPSRDKVLP